jgi:N-acetylglutamate synthase-like GNAT family acetyltransferase
MTVRRAAAGDEPALARLLGELGYPVARERLAARMARLPETTVVLVADDGGVVGLAALDVRVYLEHDEPRGRVIAFVVGQEARGRGAGRALMDAVEAEARRAGAADLHVTSGAHREDAHAAYRALGFEQTGLRFGKRL